MSAALQQILSHKRREVDDTMARRPLREVERAAQVAPPVRSLYAALHRGPHQPLRAIAEIKRASPSAGPIRPGANPVEIAEDYANAGASAISVLTDETFFDGHLSFIGRVRTEVDLPILRKDFIVDPYQVVEARAAGADAVLLIVAALSDRELEELSAEAKNQGLAALIEVHDQHELDRALSVGAAIIGINHRNLTTLEIDLSLSEKLAPSVPSDVLLVAESGIRTPDDVEEVSARPVHAMLVGESLMRAESPGAALKTLLERA